METKAMELEILTPVHIGSHEGKFSSYDYAVSGNNLYVIHQGKLADFLRGGVRWRSSRAWWRNRATGST